jgi:hypothetical protein
MKKACDWPVMKCEKSACRSISGCMAVAWRSCACLLCLLDSCFVNFYVDGTKSWMIFMKIIYLEFIPINLKDWLNHIFILRKF